LSGSAIELRSHALVASFASAFFLPPISTDADITA
jgi:hypothetical protein